MPIKRNNKEREIKWREYGKYTKLRRTKKIKVSKKCCVCDSEKRICGHHPNYENYLDVMWLCAICHARLHSQIRRLQSKYLKTRQKEYTKKDFGNNSKIFNRFRKIFILHNEKALKDSSNPLSNKNKK